jgi:glutaminyl-peptide cyclotransferase
LLPPSTGATAPTSTVTPATTGSTLPTTTTIPGPQQLRVGVIERRPHDGASVTQGLELDDGVLYESAGTYGESSVRIVDPVTGEVRQRVDLDDAEFAEGLTVVDDTVIVLTWKEHVAHVLDADTLEERGTFSYDTEGWGLCDDGDRLVMSDGTSTLRFRDRSTFAEVGRVEVTFNGDAVPRLNELECVDGAVYANVWQTDAIVRIDPGSGEITAVVDASGLIDDSERVDSNAVLNGIAYDDATDTFLITGKRWPAMFEVRFVPA